MASCYILFSPRIQSYYVGLTTEPIETRLSRHNENYYPDKWSSHGIPWEIFLVIECQDLTQARKIEAHIKRMKSRKYLENLKRFPEMVLRLKNRFPGLPDTESASR